MKLYEAEYRIEQGEPELEDRLQNDFEVDRSEKNIVQYAHPISSHFIKTYVHNKEDRVLTENCYTDLYFDATIAGGGALSILQILHIGEYPSPFSDLMVTATATLCTILYLIPILLINQKPNYMSTTDPPSSRFPTMPVVFRSRFNINLLVPIVSMLGFINLQPWLTPKIGIFPISIFSIWVVIFSISVEGNRDRVTTQILYIGSVSSLPLLLAAGNMISYSQYEKILEQNVAFMSKIPYVNDGVVMELYNISLQLKLPIILALNGLAVIAFVYLSPMLISFLFVLIPSRYNTISPGDNKKVRYGISATLLAYVSSILYVVYVQIFGSQPKFLNSTIDLLLLLAPLILFFVAWMYDWIRKTQQYHLRSAKPSTRLIEDTDSDIQLKYAKLGKSAAISINRFWKSPLILVDYELREELTDAELHAIYYHEKYHIKNGVQKHQQFFQLPIVGFIYFLLFVDPDRLYHEEFKADRYAAKMVGQLNIKSALQKVEDNEKYSEFHPIKQSIDNVNGGFEIFKLSWRLPLHSIYRPPRQRRIEKLES
jgi:hypothetical protein